MNKEDERMKPHDKRYKVRQKEKRSNYVRPKVMVDCKEGVKQELDGNKEWGTLEFFCM